MKSYKGYLIDLDGTIYRGKEPIPAAKRFIDKLQEKGIPFLFVTNNSTQTPEKVVQNLSENFDIHVNVDNVYTSGLATADYVADLDEKKRSAYVIGESGLKKALFDKGFTFEEEEPDYTIVGLDYDVTYHKFELATLAIRNGSRFIGTNADTNLPNERGLVPGAGSVISLVECATQQKATYIGKPEPIIMEKALKRIGLSNNEVIMVGDNYMTDILAGIRSNIDTLLVYTGVSTHKLIEQKEIKPTYEIESLDEWKF
ncbi:TIGR01457 family HAD-type hydrolase [Liquorilactobacillus mali]|uniref:Acid sugar phosphatase n=1 Tax=Liquorilactobacillus mali TaxID=1618 RepID=A0A0R2FE21_9LACO|nr:TIGR01457 family HAD-type hydrolase [Liquorilactobacillus mali]KRN26850.1 N-acetylglucosamine catabolic protein [Liquorilactobacillus mali]MDN7146528.1 TIGR01457 family HAD-type hydrolase [Liquorilactobacillus mali]